MVFIICVLIGVMTAFLGSLMGLGGGIILIPSLLFLSSFMDSFAWATPQTIVGISLVTMIFTALSSTIAYHKIRRLDYKTGLLFLSGSIPGSVLGSWLNQFFNADNFLLYFGLVMIVMSFLFFVKLKPKGSQSVDGKGRVKREFYVNGVTHIYSVSIWLAFFISLFVGTLSGLFGIGGGAIMVPAMILLFGIPIHIATGISMFMILFVSIIGASTHIALGHIAWEYVFFFIPGAWLGAKLGVIVNQKLTGQALVWIFRILLIFIGLRMIFQGLA
ncbi:sulfite exporter TauE/SafE family protein [Virgibacillus sp. NKC19-16]|uniref:sulfite exporter TauE/SafE family protein n=1 Tax=Virgibacillus salidurans TaxID=2831673 RepID=UPI001F38A300|nr:sulfite exporter TauE/SafE family protein [Virgibacillus sp. NKC19-16]UJL45197.1 sulfite exporter TauE/SafE family protein [Virgibacillus sp. NKC19-16]